MRFCGLVGFHSQADPWVPPGAFTFPVLSERAPAMASAIPPAMSTALIMGDTRSLWSRYVRVPILAPCVSLPEIGATRDVTPSIKAGAWGWNWSMCSVDVIIIGLLMPEINRQEVAIATRRLKPMGESLCPRGRCS